MRKCIFWTPVRPGERRRASIGSPQSELHIPSPGPCGKGTVGLVRIDGEVPLMGDMSSNSVIDSACEPRATLAPLAASNKLGGEHRNALSAVHGNDARSAERNLSVTYEKERNGNMKEVACRYTCALTSSPKRTLASTDTVATPVELYTLFCRAAELPPPAMEQQQQQQQPRVRSPIPERPDTEAPVSTFSRGPQRWLGRRLKSPMPDEDNDYDVTVSCGSEKLLVRGEKQGNQKRDEECGQSILVSCSDKRLQDSAHVTAENTVASVPPKKPPVMRSPLPRFLGASSTPLDWEARQHIEGGKWCSPDTASVRHRSRADPTCAASVGHHPAAETCEPCQQSAVTSAFELRALPEEPPGDALTVVDIDLSPDTSAPELVDWHVLVEESITLDLTVGSEEVEEAPQQPVRCLESPFLPTNAGCGGVHNVDNSRSFSTLPASAASTVLVAEEKEAMRLSPQSPQQWEATWPLPLDSRDSVAYQTLWPPSTQPMDSNSFGSACDEEEFGVIRHSSPLKSVLARLAANKDHHLHGGGGGEVRSTASPLPSPPLTSVSSTAEMQGSLSHQRKTHQFDLAPLPLVVELCRALLPFARRLLLLLAQESGGSAGVVCEVCAEVANSILEAEGVRHVRATRHLCRTIAVLGGADALDDSALPYAIFVASLLQLAGGP
ncbi:hypothetical protein TraAM80_05586 [Trypanosoma rangeli]|uniref:Uncharacterized protein n=1 Tax=Trypanosoma rangeli TaxID=5698 RepID=A0A3R7LUR2_TRYRA|nr:uncharacterized protein TraAM80_05586 [Trypanosoma rangeli]RNF03646.1 hypothetical protein TraAM80_05586 [Trypanosoma rangeli]|eukprot:RNF03646.1 hypothetical protein TraAM80_05586 [Trypanosoma rangeli]